MFIKFFKCECFTGGLEVTDEAEDKHVYLSLWSYGQGGSLTWKEQLRYIWRILTKGKPYEDCLILDYKTARELGHDLVNITEKVEGPKFSE